MVNNVYSLPKINFVGGESQSLYFHLYTKDGGVFDANGCEASLSIINFQHSTGDPTFVKNVAILENENGVRNIALVNLLPNDTVNLFGRYVYQLSIRDPDGDIELHKGQFDITNNTCKSFVTQ